MKFGKRRNLQNIKRVGEIFVLSVFILLALTGAVQGQEKVMTGCSGKNADCMVFVAVDVHAISSFETMLGHQLFQSAFEGNSGESKKLGILFLAAIIWIEIYVWRREASFFYQYWFFARRRHAKFWDFLHQAISKGIIHSKTLDCA